MALRETFLNDGDGDFVDYENRIVSSQEIEGEGDADKSLRPKTLDEYIGQEKAKENLKVYIDAAKQRGDTLDHVLLYGPPGLGKPTLSAVLERHADTVHDGRSGLLCDAAARACVERGDACDAQRQGA